MTKLLNVAIKATQAYERREFEQALRLYHEAAAEGHPYYLVLAAEMYIHGEGTPVDFQKAEKLLAQARALGVREATLQEATLHWARGDREKYFQTLRQSADEGLLPAKYQVAICYERGFGVAKNKERALEIMRAAMREGHVGAKMFVGKRLMKRPTRLRDFLLGVLLFITALWQSIHFAVTNPYNDRFR